MKKTTTTTTKDTARANYEKMLDALKAARAEYDNGEPLPVHISRSNKKMGAVPSVSTLPIVTCPRVCWEQCAKKCYAAKCARFRKNVQRTYAHNTVISTLDTERYFAAIDIFCRGQRFFRWHVSGDIPGGELGRQYFAAMVEIARNNAKCDFLAFTKNAAIVNAYISENGRERIPENFHVIFSNWGAFKLPNPYNLPMAEVVFNGTDPADNWKICGGNCYECACRGVGCWQLKDGETIAFPEH